jgi:peptidoglycan/LPS O-acetylase OafA/YrhL
LLLSRLPDSSQPPQTGWIWSQVFWLHAAQQAAALIVLLRVLRLMDASYNWLPFGDLVMLPGCVVLIAIAGRKELPGLKIWATTAFLAAAAGCVIFFAAHKPLGDPRWAAVLGFTVAGLVGAWLQPVFALVRLAWIGTFSYGLYAVHMPIFVVLSSWYVSSAAGVGRALAAWMLTLLLAAWLELRWQPWIRRTLQPRPKT